MCKMERVSIVGVAALAVALCVMIGCWGPAPAPQAPPPAPPPPAPVAPAPLPVPIETPSAAPAVTPAPAPAPAATPAEAAPTPAEAAPTPAEAAPAPAPMEPVASTTDPSTPKSKEEALAMWQEAAKTASAEKPNLVEGTMAAKKLAEFGPEALQPIYDTLADKASSPRAKALAAISLVPVLDKDASGRLLPMTKPENDVTTRVCATKLLTNLAGAEIDAALAQLKADADHQVRFQALRALAVRSPQGRKELIEFFSQPGTSLAEKQDILTLLASVPATDSLGVFHDIVRSGDFDEEAKLAALAALAVLADPSSETIVAELAANGPNEAIRNAAKEAHDAVIGRKNAAAAIQSNPPKPAPAAQ